jgi:hypothetical protein
MSHSPSPFGDGFEPFDPSQSIEEIEKVVLDLEPKIRDLNRHFVDVFGPCPGADSTWVYLARNEEGEFFIGFTQIPVGKAGQLSSRLIDVYRILEEADEVIVQHHAHQAQLNLGPAILGDAAKVRFTPTTHVRVERD